MAFSDFQEVVAFLKPALLVEQACPEMPLAISEWISRRSRIEIQQPVNLLTEFFQRFVLVAQNIETSYRRQNA
jgi:hypothetical protein